MSVEFEKCNDFDNPLYYKIDKLPGGQSVGIAFHHIQNKKRDVFSVVFAITNKRKDIKSYLFSEKGMDISLLSTGKSGLEGLLWAKKMIYEFENAIINKKIWRVKEENVFIVVIAEDSQRARVYKRGLRSFNYIEDYTLGFKSLMKKIC